MSTAPGPRPICVCGKPAVRQRANLALPRAQKRGENDWIEFWAFPHHARDCPRLRAELAAMRRFRNL